MAYTFDAVGWEDFEGNRWTGLPDEPEDAHGIWVHYYDPENSDDQGMFWAYALRGAFDDWSEWWVYIGGLMVANYGMVLADE